MTIIKQHAVSDKSHQQNLRKYINDDRKVLLRGSQHMEHCVDIKRWAAFMKATRRRFGHDKASRYVRDKETGELVEARNTIMYHQILAFLPEECDINGGKMTPERCMAYAREYAQAYYPNQEIVFALHNEYCKEDMTHRYAVHMVINRSDLATGKRLDEGRGKDAKVKRAARVRTLDDKWDLHQVEEGVANSTLHKRQPSRVEKEIAARGGRSYKTNLRELCRLAAERSENIYEYRELLEGWGVDTQFRNGRMYVTDTDNARYSFSVARLDADLNKEGLAQRFRENFASSARMEGEKIREARHEESRIQAIREGYLKEIRRSYLEYRDEAEKLEGVPLKDFPKLRLPRPPEKIAGDSEIRRAILSYWRGADELRASMASQVPYTRKPDAGAASSMDAESRESHQTKGSREKGR